MTYQKITGTLSQGAHPGSYNGQDAWNDMLVTDESSKRREWSATPDWYANDSKQLGLYARPTGNFSGGGCSMNEPTYMSDRKGHNSTTEDGTAATLNAQEKERPLIGTSVVRRLTPMECERLQGFPDDWSKYGTNDNGNVYELSDSARYKLQGNSICRPFWTWLMRRIAAQYERPATMGSLFSGQGGFELCAKEAGVKPVWASEIEKHAVSVVRYHFGDEDMGIEGDVQW